MYILFVLLFYVYGLLFACPLFENVPLSVIQSDKGTSDVDPFIRINRPWNYRPWNSYQYNRFIRWLSVVHLFYYMGFCPQKNTTVGNLSNLQIAQAIISTHDLWTNISFIAHDKHQYMIISYNFSELSLKYSLHFQTEI